MRIIKKNYLIIGGITLFSLIVIFVLGFNFYNNKPNDDIQAELIEIPNNLDISSSNNFLKEDENISKPSTNTNKGNATDSNNGTNTPNNTPTEKVINMVIYTNTKRSKTGGYIDGKEIQYEQVLNTYYDSSDSNLTNINTDVKIKRNKYYPILGENKIDLCDSKACLEIKYTIDNKEINIDVSQYKELKLKFQYIVRNSGIDMIRFNTASIYVYDKDGKMYGPYEIENFEYSNIINRAFEDGKLVDKVKASSLEYVYDVESENLLKDNIKSISRVVLVPYAKYDEYKDYFKWNNMSITGSKEIETKTKNTYSVSETLIRNRVVSNMIANATVEWSPGGNNNIVYIDPAKKEFEYDKDYFFYGMPYIDGIDTTRNSFMANVNQRNYQMPTKANTTNDRKVLDHDKMRGLYCSSSVYEAVSESLPMDTNLSWTKAYVTSPSVKYLGGLEYYYGSTGDSYNTENVKEQLIKNISNGKHTINNNKVVDYTEAEKYAKDIIYNAYAQLKPGDGVIHYNEYSNTCKEYNSVLIKQFKKQGSKIQKDSNGKEYYAYSEFTNKGHVMLVTGKTVVVKDSNGKINPDKSYVVVTEITNSTGNTTNRHSIANNTSFIGDDIYSNELKTNFGFNKIDTRLKSLKDLDGSFTQWNVHRKVSFSDLYVGMQCSMYVPFTFKNYNSTGKDTVQIEKATAKLVNGNTIDDITNGLKGTIIGNSTIQAIKFKVESFGTQKNVKRETKYEYTYYPDSTMIYSLYYQGFPEEEKFIKAIKNIKANKENIYDVTISVVLGSKVKNGKIGSDEVAVFYYKSNYYFNDMNFYSCVVDGYNEATGKGYNYSARLGADQLKEIKNLPCSNKNITSTKGIDKLINLETIDLSNNKISTIDLSKNIKLNTLKIYNNKLTTLDLTSNKNIKTLYIYENKTQDTQLNKKYSIE